MRYALIALLMLCSSAYAADTVVSWTHPIAYEDDSALPLTDITATVVEWGRCAAGVFPAQAEGSVVVAAPVASVPVAGLAPNVPWCFRAATEVGTVRSEWSATAMATFLRRPRPPGIVAPSAFSVVIE